MKKIFIIIVIFITILIIYSFYLAPKIIVVKQYTIKNNLIPDGFDGVKIVHFSDLLYSNESPNILDSLIKKINEQKPDIVFFTGDLINSKLTNNKQNKLTKELKKIEAKLGKYAILGDKDPKASKEVLTNSGFNIVENQIFLYNEDVISIVIDVCNTDNEYETFSICLIHKPDNIKSNNDNLPSLILAGHSLGGQIRIPFWGALIKIKGAKKYSDNYYQLSNSQMYISNGIGNGNLNIRIFNEPSINVYRLKAN